MVGLIVFGILYYTQKDSKETIPKYFTLLNVFSAIVGLIWSYIISSVLIDLLSMVGIIAKLDSTYLGLTILAVGNALPDSLTVVSLAKTGHATMGITGVYAG